MNFIKKKKYNIAGQSITYTRKVGKTIISPAACVIGISSVLRHCKTSPWRDWEVQSMLFVDTICL